jgi:branched-chain amino acid transport system substrate-binding protein
MQDNRTKLNAPTRRQVVGGIGLGTAATLLGMPLVARAQVEPIRIGFPTPLTGPFGAEARDQVKSAELAVKQFNDVGGLGGRKAELLVRDDKLNAGEAATRTLELIEKDRSMPSSVRCQAPFSSRSTR